MTYLAAQKKEKWENRLTVAAFVVLLALLLAFFFDFYYDLNDDSFMKDILAGVHTGSPEAHNIQMLYPLSWLLSLCYRLVPRLPWYGAFLCLCQLGSLWLMGLCLIRGCSERKARLGRLFLLGLTWIALLLPELVFIQYTVTAGLLMSAAVVWFYSSREGLNVRDFFYYNAISAALSVTAFYMRTEMMLLLLPFLFLAGLFRWSLEREFFSRENLIKYAGLAGILGAFMLLGVLVNRSAYGTDEWREFMTFFDERTRVYDYYGIPSYDENREFYDSIGLSRSEYTLLENYNFGLDERIDAGIMGEIADYAAEHPAKSLGRRLYLSVYDYVYRLLHSGDIPWNLLIIGGYFLLIHAAGRRNRGLYWKILLLAALRNAIWLFLTFRGRMPERITHPLYFMEFVLMVLLLLHDVPAERWKKYGKTGILCLYVVLLVCGLALAWNRTWEQSAERAEKNAEWQAVQQYCRERPENFYFVDVYSTVAYSEKMFNGVDNSYRNYDVLGGWASKSPITAAKLDREGVETIEDALAENDNIYFIVRKDREISWLEKYYEERGRNVSLKEADRIGRFYVIHVE